MGTRVIVNGAKGKMGQETIKAVNNDNELILVAECDLGDNLHESIISKEAQVVVDFTRPDDRMENTIAIVESGASAVIGTTGFTESDLKTLEEKCNEKGKCIIIAPNFAIGAVLMMKFCADAAKYMPNSEIIEMHHNKKLDAPSGTAIKTAALINDAIQSSNIGVDENYDSTKHQNPEGVRGGKIGNVPIHSIRLEGYVASQEVIFGGLGQTLRIRHDTISRESFMPGVIMAVKFAVKNKGLFYGLETIL